MTQNSKLLIIAGSDSGGGAGIQADIKSASANGVFTTTAITAITAQNTMGVIDIHPIPIEMIEKQIDAVLSDIGTDAVKIGMLHSAQTIQCVFQTLQKYNVQKIVLDPVMISTSGHRLISKDSIETLCSTLIPYSTIITPNIPEAEVLLNRTIKTLADMQKAILEMADKFHVSILLKAGHLDDLVLTDLFYNQEDGNVHTLSSKKIETKNTHGTGCTLSSAIAANLAKNLSLTDAVFEAKRYINQAIKEGANYKIGNGQGPVHHFYEFWEL